MAFSLRTTPPAVTMLVGLQGVGKTTTAAKLAMWLKESKKKNVLLAGCDISRPAAIEQLASLAGQIGVDVFQMPVDEKTSSIDRAKAALKYAENHFYDVLIVDTAGRNNINESLMVEMQAMAKAIKPVESLLVVDSLMGQQALSVAASFEGKLDLTGLILTKVDSDARGGAALSAKFITQKPIKFLGSGEKVAALEVFHPDRIASRILGLGDIVSLAEQAEKQLDHKKNLNLRKKLKAGGNFTLEDFRHQINEVNKMGGLSQMLEKLPFGNAPDHAVLTQAQQFKRFGVMIDSMTIKERKMPDILDSSRKLRVANGSGNSVPQLNTMLKQFKQIQKMMKKTNKPGGMKNMQRMMQQMQGGAGPSANMLK